MAKDHAQKRIDNGNEGKVPFLSAVPTKDRPEQLSHGFAPAYKIGPLHRTITDQRYNYLGISQG